MVNNAIFLTAIPFCENSHFESTGQRNIYRPCKVTAMSYRHRDSISRKLRAMRDARERRRLEASEPPSPRDLPSLRRTLMIIDHDFGTVEHRIDLYCTRRIDCYRAVADDVEWKRSIGWSKVLAGLRVKFPRVRAP